MHVVRPDGEGHRRVSGSPLSGAMGGWGAAPAQPSFTWPCWSPDDRWLSVFEAEGEEEDQNDAVLTVLEVDGVEERRLHSFDKTLPIYARWSPEGDRLGVLAQGGDDLLLTRCAVDEVGSNEHVVSGVPLFFSWLDGGALLVHVGDSKTGGSRVFMQGVAGRDILTERPGSFCTPLTVGEQIMYATSRGRRSRICLLDPSTRRHRDLTELEGLLALVPDAARDHAVLVGAAPGGEHTPYDGIWQLDVRTGLLKRLVDEPVMAFHWDRTGSRVIYAVLESDRSCMVFRAWEAETGEVRDLCPFWPSRDQLFYLHFFEQFTGSHHLVSPDGRTLVFSGYPDPRRAEEGGGPRIHVLDILNPTGGPLTLAEGRFAVFSHA